MRPLRFSLRAGSRWGTREYTLGHTRVASVAIRRGVAPCWRRSLSRLRRSRVALVRAPRWACSQATFDCHLKFLFSVFLLWKICFVLCTPLFKAFSVSVRRFSSVLRNNRLVTKTCHLVLVRGDRPKENTWCSFLSLNPTLNQQASSKSTVSLQLILAADFCESVKVNRFKLLYRWKTL